MGLIGGIARTAVIAGTATAVSNNVSRRQAARWAAKEQAASPPPRYPSEPSPPQTEDSVADQLDRLAAMRESGQLTDGEYSAAKARVLGR